MANSSDSPEYQQKYGQYERNQELTKGYAKQPANGPSQDGCLPMIIVGFVMAFAAKTAVTWLVS